MSEITINYLDKDQRLFEVLPLTLKRDWLSDTADKFAYRCIPLRIVNTYGWSVISPFDFTVSWFGGGGVNDVEITCDDPRFLDDNPISYFGYGTFSIAPDFIITTPESYSTYVRGVPNKNYKIVTPTDAIVETDWLPYPFTYTFFFTEPGVVEFKKGDELFSFFPVERGSVEDFKLKSSFLGDNKQLSTDFHEYSKSALNAKGKRLWHKEFYSEGKLPNRKISVKNHIARLFFGTMDK